QRHRKIRSELADWPGRDYFLVTAINYSDLIGIRNINVDARSRLLQLKRFWMRGELNRTCNFVSLGVDEREGSVPITNDDSPRVRIIPYIICITADHERRYCHERLPINYPHCTVVAIRHDDLIHVSKVKDALGFLQTGHAPGSFSLRQVGHFQ